MRQGLIGIAFGIAVTVLALVFGLASMQTNGPAFLERAADLLLLPGYVVMRSPGPHDPAGIAASIVLNVLLYAAAAVLFQLWRQHRRGA